MAQNLLHKEGIESVLPFNPRLDSSIHCVLPVFINKKGGKKPISWSLSYSRTQVTEIWMLDASDDESLAVYHMCM